ncbi:acyl carrier protein [Arenibacter palladensis]|uniref:acyl carrier protein n=1 Tax=Arenibacter palladensis TaxID=237373 RepID=UPI0026E1FE2D|nr:acyl carrier protein [Arenibacter palladensis]MDO6605136.1 acyl carrier protein [Arenibacter palladensis]
MTRTEILSQINEVFIDTLDNEDIAVEETTRAIDVDEWDSLTHILLVVAIEKKFKISFKSSEIQNWKDVGEMMDCLQEKGI